MLVGWIYDTLKFLICQEKFLKKLEIISTYRYNRKCRGVSRFSAELSLVEIHSGKSEQAADIENFECAG